MDPIGDSRGVFTQCMVDADQESLRRGRRFRRWGLAVSLVLQAGLLVALVLAPLVTPAVLPHFVTLVPVPVLRPAPPPPLVQAETVTRAVPSIYTPNTNNRPAVHARLEPSAAILDPGISVGLGPDTDTPAAVSWLGNSAQPPVPRPPAEAAQGPIHKGSGVMEAMLVNRVEPAYPASARIAHVSGPVVISAVIAADGSIQSLKVVSGSPLLAGAALTAVREWRYKPTLLNGVPVEVETLITVNFVLDY
jgi:protein TonB